MPQEEKNCLAHVRAACDARLPGLGRGDPASGKATITGVKDVKGDVRPRRYPSAHRSPFVLW